MCHVPSVVNELWSQTYAPLRTQQHTDAVNECVRKAIASVYRNDSDTVFLGLLTIYVPILYCQRFRSQMREIFTLSWSRIPEMSRRVPKISDEFRETSERYRKFNVRRCSGRLLSTSEETTILACLDFVRTKKDTESSCVKDQFVWICESGVGNCPWCVRLMSLVHRPKTQAWCVYNWSVVSRTRRSMQAYVPLRDFSVVTARENELRERIPVPHDNFFKSI